MKFALFCADGRAFFLGLGMMAAAFMMPLKPRLGRLSNVLLVFGAAFVLLSSTPMPWWTCVPLIVGAVAWLALRRAVRTRRWPRVLCVATATAACALAAAVEIPHLYMPRLDGGAPSRVYVIGDSLSAGLHRDESTWPRMLKARGMDVVDLSQAGATVQSAMVQARQIRPGAAVVIIEIGGNDLLGSTSRQDFEAGLQRLLDCVRGENRRLLMFELPLPPFSHAYGDAQRRLAARYGAKLIPKRVLSGVIGSSNGTLDGLHLSEAGHEAIAATVMGVLSTSRSGTKPAR